MKESVPKSMGDAVLKKFGKYILLDKLATGGMAEIYRARLATADGAGRLVVIKRIQSGFGENKDFLQMFKSEIQVTMGFNHPGIVQLYDFGEIDKQPYIVMEYVDGKNLRQLISKFIEKKQAYPIELAVYVIEQAAGSLHYAHFFRDKMTGEALNIVHRDISPQNILISYDGTVKLIDFGIAKATLSNREATRVGVIKGKPSYLSPEQVAGQPLDGRSDIFSLGIVLWEILTGRKLFAAGGNDSEFAVLKLIESCQTHVKPPSTYNPKIPKELDYIVLHALTKQREQRYQTAGDFQRALHKFLYAYFPDFNPADLGLQIKKLFQNEIVEDRKHIQGLNAKVGELLTDEIPEMPTGATAVEGPTGSATVQQTAQVEGGTRLVGPSRDRMNLQFDAQHEKVEIEDRTFQKGIPAGARNRSGPVVATSPSLYRDRSTSSAIIVKQRRRTWIFATIAAGLVAVFGYMQMGQKDVNNALPAQEQEQIQAQTPPQSMTGPSILLKLKIDPDWGAAQITLNGQAVSALEQGVRVPLDSSLELEVEKPGFKPFKREFVLQSTQYQSANSTQMDVVLEPLKYGTITLTSTPSAEVMIRGVDPENRTIASDGKPWIVSTPINDLKVPVGTYTLKLSNQVLGMEKELTFTVEEGKVIREDVRLEIK